MLQRRLDAHLNDGRSGAPFLLLGLVELFHVDMAGEHLPQRFSQGVGTETVYDA